MSTTRILRGATPALIILALLPLTSTASALDPDAPLPPVASNATLRADGVAISWEAPAYGGTSPVTSYQVYALNNTTRVALGSTGPDATSFLDATGVAYTAYFVTASNAAGESLPSNPIRAYPYCNVYYVSLNLTSPLNSYVELDPNPRCLWPPPFIPPDLIPFDLIFGPH